MTRKLREFQTLTAQGNAVGTNPKLTALKVELAHVEAEIEKLLDTLTGANDILISYANVKIAELDSCKQALAEEIADLAADEVSPDQLVKLSALLDNWDEANIDEKRVVVDALIEKINIVGERVDIKWKI
jgi:hypothetical protein